MPSTTTFWFSNAFAALLNQISYAQLCFLVLDSIDIFTMALGRSVLFFILRGILVVVFFWDARQIWFYL